MNNLSFHVAHLELTSKCNFQCHFCPIDDISRSSQIMKKELAFRLVEEIANNNLAKVTVFQQLGEPLLVPYLGELMEFSSQLGLKNRIGTNGLLLSKKKNLGYILKHCDNLDIGIRASNQEELSSICKNKNISFDNYLDGIKLFIAEMLKQNSETVITLRLFMGELTQQILNKIGIDYSLNNTPLMVPIEHKGLFLYFEECLDRNWTEDKNNHSRHIGTCEEFFYSFVILANGDMTTCCWDYDGQNTFGNIHSYNSIIDVLSGKKYLNARKLFSQNVVPFKLCTTCSRINKKVYFEKNLSKPLVYSHE